ncbi:MAG: glycoside hydrolase clan, partial [Phycisphaerales bacterium]|nr:glycoside hydrolase clan [Phycisphaerales bacterium]
MTICVSAKPNTTESRLNIPDVRSLPVTVRVRTAEGDVSLDPTGDGEWRADGICVTTRPDKSGDLAITLASPSQGIRSVALHWNGSTAAVQSVMNDQWERSYGDLAWRPVDCARRLPWYTLLNTVDGTQGIGVRTQPACFAAWIIDADGVTLDCDVRSGGVPVELGERELTVCHITARSGSADESAFEVGRALCQQMCPSPRLA